MSLSAALLASLLLVVVAVTGPASAQPPPPPLRPHVLYMLVDDWGWANVPWHLPNRSDIQAPTMLSLLSQGVCLHEPGTKERGEYARWRGHGIEDRGPG